MKGREGMQKTPESVNGKRPPGRVVSGGCRWYRSVEPGKLENL